MGQRAHCSASLQDVPDGLPLLVQPLTAGTAVQDTLQRRRAANGPCQLARLHRERRWGRRPLPQEWRPRVS
jgi:hypothetical protein